MRCFSELLEEVDRMKKKDDCVSDLKGKNLEGCYPSYVLYPFTVDEWIVLSSMQTRFYEIKLDVS